MPQIADAPAPPEVADASVPTRVEGTPLTRVWLKQLAEQHGPLLIHQSGGCCDGSAPMCYPRDGFVVGERDVLLGWIDAVPVFIGERQFEYWQHTHLTIDVVPGRGSGFSVEAPEGIRFLTRSRLFRQAETERLEAAGAPRCGPGAIAVPDRRRAAVGAAGD